MKESRYCKYWGRKQKRGMEKFQVYDKTCSKCLKRNHFSCVCQQSVPPPRRTASWKDIQKSKPKVHELREEFQPSTEDEPWVLSFPKQFNAVSSSMNRINATMEIGNKTVEMQIDTGASCNVLSWYLPASAEIQETKPGIVTSSRAKLSVLGTTMIVPVRNRRNIAE